MEAERVPSCISTAWNKALRKVNHTLLNVSQRPVLRLSLTVGATGTLFPRHGQIFGHFSQSNTRAPAANWATYLLERYSSFPLRAMI